MIDTVEIKKIRGHYEQCYDKMFESSWYMDGVLEKDTLLNLLKKNRKPDLSHKH